MRVALVGNQNSGKSSLFNVLCNTRQKTGNWPGVTIDKKEGLMKNKKDVVIDLPGTYTLNPYTLEERITCDYLNNEKVDLVINVIDATLLERSLYLTMQLLEKHIPLIIVLNMSDLLVKQNISLDTKRLEKELGIPVINISCKNHTGLNELKEVMNNKQVNKIKFFNDKTGINAVQLRYKRIDMLIEKVLIKEEINHRSIDRILLNKYFGIPIFIIIMSFIYFLSLNTLGGYLSSLMTGFFDSFKISFHSKLMYLGASSWITSLICDGVITGVGAVIVFIPQLFILFFLMGILEGSGYLSRITLLLDRIFKKLGLNGKSAISFILGTGCSVPGILSTRAIENQNERELTLSLISIIPCSAKLPIIILITSAFFPYQKTIMAISLYIFAIIIVICLALLFKEKNNDTLFLSELPKLQFPSVKNILKDAIDKCLDFTKRAGTIILFSSIIIWCFAHLTINLSFTEDISCSLLKHIGSLIAPLFHPILGVNSWESSISIIQGLVAKEQVVASMKILSESSDVFNSNAFSFFTPITAFSFCVFNLFSAPCISAISAMSQELNSKKKAVKTICVQTLFAYALSTLITLVGGFFLV